MKKRKRKSKYEIINELLKDQEDDCERVVVWTEIITPYVLREYDFLIGNTWRVKAFDLLFRLNWKEEWIAKAMKVSVRTVVRMKQMVKFLSA